MRKLFIILFITQICLIFAIEVDHFPVFSVNEDEPIAIELHIRSSFDTVKGVQLLYKGLGESVYTAVEMDPGSETDPLYRFDLTELSTFWKGVEYYFLITDQDDFQQYLPAISPEINPFRIMILQAKTVSGEFILLSPDPEIPSDSADLTIAVSYFSLMDDIVPNTIKFQLDGKDVTKKAKITANMLLFQVKDATPGSHYYRISAQTKTGNMVESPIWKHLVPGEIKTQEFKYSGDVAFTSRVRRTEADDTESEDDNHSLQLNLRGKYKKLKMLSRIYISSREDAEEQAVNRYSLKLAIPHLEFIGGDHSPNMGIFTANNRNLRGVHTNVLFHGFRLYTSYGEIYRCVEGKVDSNYTNSEATFKRNSLAFRTEFGTRKLLQLGLSFSKTKDDVGSLSEEFYISPLDDTPLVTPKDNLVLASDLRLALFKQKLVTGMELAISLYNDNIIGGAIDKDSLEADLGEDIPFDPESLENIFVINKNVSPIRPSAASTAYNIYLKWMLKNNLLNISYSAVGSSFNSLAVNYLFKDTSLLSIFDNLTLMQNRLIVSLGVNLMTDNIYDDKLITSKSANVFSQVMYRPQNLPYFSVAFSNSNSENDQDDEDEAVQAMDLRSNNFSFNTGYYVNSIIMAPTLFTAGFTNNVYTDEANDSFEYSRSSINVSARSDFSAMPLRTLISYTLAFNNDVTEAFDTYKAGEEKYETTFQSVYLSTKFTFSEGKYKPYADLRISTETGDLKQNSLMGNVGLMAVLYPDLTLKTSIGMANYNNEDLEDGDSSRLNFKMKLKYKF
jgi:hypothetical protein